jgi:hypothetical protein
VGEKEELDKLERELARLTPAERQRDFQKRAFGYVVSVAICVGIWALTGAAYFWPGWVMLFGGIDIARRAYTLYANPPPDDPDTGELQP